MNSATRKTDRSGPFRYFTCACGRRQGVNPGMPWCAGCGVEYDVRACGVILRPGRTTPRYAVAKALNLAEGVKIGTRP